VVISVVDDGHWRPPRGENRGRGLTIIETAVDDFDVNTASTGTEVIMRRRVKPR
jgi:anti-sigma regulatory factor (Ser/Thr protein kinase)